MAVTVTQDWSKQTYTPGESATSVFLVTGVETEKEASQSKDEATQLRVPAEFEKHPRDDRLAAGKPAVVQIAPNNIYQVTVSYSPRKEFTYQWEQIDLQIPTAVDADGIPLTNSVGDPISPMPELDSPIERLTIVSREQSYDRAKANVYRRKVNKAKLSLPGGGEAAPGQLLCVSIAPVGPHTPYDTQFEIRYVFDLNPDGWQWKFVDAGTRAYYPPKAISATSSTYTGSINDLQGGFGHLYYADGEQVTTPVKLNGKGQPIDDAVAVTRNLLKAIESPFTKEFGVELSANGKCALLLYRRYREAEMEQLGFFR